MINLSFIKLKGSVIDNYTKSLKGFRNKDVLWEDIHKVVGSSKIQFTPFIYNNGVKLTSNLDRSKQNLIVVDVDDNLSISECQSMFKKYRYCIATTKSHQKLKQGQVCDRYRLLLPAINIPTDDDVYFKAISIMFPFNDSQTETKTSAFLGNDEAIVIKNEGKSICMFKATEKAIEAIKAEKVDKIIVPKELRTVSYGRSNLVEVKDKLTKEITQDILEDLGIEFVNGKFSLREENTKSCKIYGDYYIKDYGSSDDSGSIFDVIMNKENISFSEALKIVSNYV